MPPSPLFPAFLPCSQVREPWHTPVAHVPVTALQFGACAILSQCQRTHEASAALQDVWPVATQLAEDYAGGSLFTGYFTGLDRLSPSEPYLKFRLGSHKVKTPPVKNPGVEVNWPEPLELPADPHADGLEVCSRPVVRQYSKMPARLIRRHQHIVAPASSLCCSKQQLLR